MGLLSSNDLGGKQHRRDGSTGTQHPSTAARDREVMRWALPVSVALTQGISVDFFYLRLLICLNLAGHLSTDEVQCRSILDTAPRTVVYSRWAVPGTTHQHTHVSSSSCYYCRRAQSRGISCYRHPPGQPPLQKQREKSWFAWSHLSLEPSQSRHWPSMEGVAAEARERARRRRPAVAAAEPPPPLPDTHNHAHSIKPQGHLF